MTEQYFIQPSGGSTVFIKQLNVSALFGTRKREGGRQRGRRARAGRMALTTLTCTISALPCPIPQFIHVFWLILVFALLSVISVVHPELLTSSNYAISPHPRPTSGFKSYPSRSSRVAVITQNDCWATKPSSVTIFRISAPKNLFDCR